MEEYKSSEESNPPNFQESQRLVLQGYNSLHAQEEQISQALMINNTLKSNQVDIRRYPQRNRKSSNSFGDNK